MKKLTSGILKTKQHFEILDGLRGIAALSIVVFHFMEWVYTDYSKNFIGHGFLAVDFFFCLSGFVIAYAYDDRIEKTSVATFFKKRIIRLHPMVLIGTVLGLLGLLLDPFAGHLEYSSGRLILIFICSVLLIPFPVMGDRAFNLFGLNAPAWSLFWEYIFNILYAWFLHKIHRRYLMLLAILAAVVLCFAGFKAGGLSGGWSRDNFWDGGARIFFSFLAGMLIYRFNWIIKTKTGFAGLSLLLILAFCMPSFNKYTWIAELLVILLYFPIVVALGAGSVVGGKLKKLCVFLGEISYPLYLTHYAVIWIFGNYLGKYKPAHAALAWVIPTGTLLLFMLAYLTMKWYDVPVRKYLTKKLNSKKVL